MRVLRIDKATANTVVSAKHYRKTLGIFWDGFGLYDGNEIVGVCIFGQPSPSIQQHAFANRDFPVMELSRLVVNEGIKNGASFLIASALKMLKKPCAIISYADSAQGHSGIIYQATNWLYTGSVVAHDKLYIVNGELLHSMTIRDRYKTTDPCRWAKDNKVMSVPPKPKHRYFYFLGNKADVKKMVGLLSYPIIKEYPKSDKTMYDSGLPCNSYVGGGTFFGMEETA